MNVYSIHMTKRW